MMLLRLDHTGIQKLLEGYEKEVAEIKKSALTLTWYMRGGVQYTDVMNMSMEDRKLINDIVESNLEVTKKTQLPFF